MLQNNEDINILDANLKIIQSTKAFRFSVDAVILSDFCRENISKKGKILDIGSGNGIIPLLLSNNELLEIFGIEIQEDVYNLAKRNLVLNGLEDKILMFNCDVKNFSMGNSFDYIVSNPPYMKIDGKKQNINISKSVARHEITLNLEELIKNAKRLLKPRGELFLVHRTHRFLEITRVLEDNGFCVKKVKFVYFSEEKSSNLVLIQALKGKKSILEIVEPLYLKESGY